MTGICLCKLTSAFMRMCSSAVFANMKLAGIRDHLWV